jgi:DNA transposition AAA+ family ATPase
VCCPFRELQSDISRLITRVSVCVENHVCRDEFVEIGPSGRAELRIVDEAERLSNTCLEHLRDLFDRTGMSFLAISRRETLSQKRFVLMHIRDMLII